MAGIKRIGHVVLYVRDPAASAEWYCKNLGLPSNKRSRSTNAQADDFVGDPMTKHETLELVRAYYRISDPRLRKRLFEMTKTLAKTTGTSSG